MSFVMCICGINFLRGDDNINYELFLIAGYINDTTKIPEQNIYYNYKLSKDGIAKFHEIYIEPINKQTVCKSNEMRLSTANK